MNRARASRLLRAASSVHVATVAGALFSLTVAAFADAPATHVTIHADPVTGSDARPGYLLEWNAVSNAVYRVQSRNTLSQDSTWKTIDLVRPEGSLGAYKISATTGVPLGSAFYRLVLPEPEIFSVEPAIVPAGVPVDIYIIGQCFPSNALVYVGDVLQTNVTFLDPGLLRVQITFDPPLPGQIAPPQNVKVTAQESGRILAELPGALETSPTGTRLVEPPVFPPASPAPALAKRGQIWVEEPAGGAFRMKGTSRWEFHGQASENGSLSTFRYAVQSRPLVVIETRPPPGTQVGGTAVVMSGAGAYLSEGRKIHGKTTESKVVLGGVKTSEESFRAEIDSYDPPTSSKPPPNVMVLLDSTRQLNNWPGSVEVMPFSGELQHRVVDMFIPGRGINFVFARFYRSRSGPNSVMGSRWTHSYDISVEQDGSDLALHDGTGRRDVFFHQPDGTYARNEFFCEITLGADGRVKVKFPWLGEWRFNPFDGSPIAGKISTSVDAHGNTLTFTYDGSGRLTEIVDTLGRTNHVVYNTAGHLASLIDFSGRAVIYQYYGLGEAGGSPGDLKSVTSPSVTGTPNGNDFPDGKTMSYTYSTGFSNENENHLLLSVVDGKGQTACTHVYQHNQTDFEFLRCIAQQWGTNVPTYLTYHPLTANPGNSFATLKVIACDSLGNVGEAAYDSRNRPLDLREFTGRAPKPGPVTDTLNRPMNPLRADDPPFFQTRWAWNNDSLCTLVTLPRGNSVECIYERDFNPNARPIKKGDARVIRSRTGHSIALDDKDERVWRYEYDSNFGSPGLARARGVIAGKPNVGGPVTGRGNARLRAWRFNRPTCEEAAMRKGWDGTIKGRFAAGPRQTTSLDDSYSHGTGGSANRGLPSLKVDPYSGADFVVSETDPRGNVTTASYDAQGDCVRLTAPLIIGNDPPRVDFAYNSSGQLTGITNAPDGNARRRVDTLDYYDSGPQQGYVSNWIVDSTADTLAFRTTYEYGPRGNVTRCIDPRTNDWLFTYNALDQVVQRQSPLIGNSSVGFHRISTQYSFDANDNLLQVDQENRDSTGALDAANPYWTTSYEYDALNRKTLIGHELTHVVQQRTRYFYDADDNITAIHSPEAVNGNDPHNVVNYLYDERNRIFQDIRVPDITDRSVTQFDYDLNGNLKKYVNDVESPIASPTTTLIYDGFDRPITVADPMGNATTWAYDANDNLTFERFDGETNDIPGSASNLRYHEWRWNYDALDLLSSSHGAFFDPATQAPIGDGESTHTFSYAPNGLLLSETDDNGNTTRYAYDTANRLSTVTDAKSNRVDYAYDNNGNVVRDTDKAQSDVGSTIQGFETTYAYDALNRCVSSTDNVANTEQYFYDSRDNLVRAVDAAGHVSGATYDGFNRVTLALADVDGDGLLDFALDAGMSYAWDDNNRLVAVTDSNTNRTTYAYDSRDRRVLATSPDGTRHTFLWDSRSELASSTDANGTVVSYTYDLNDRCVRKDIMPGPGVAATTTFEQFAYGGDGDLVMASNDVSRVEFAYNSLGDCTTRKQDGLITTCTYDGVGNCLSLRYPGGRGVQYSYNALNELSSVSTPLVDGAPPVLIAAFAYEGPGRVGRIARANGINTRYVYDGIAGAKNPPGDSGWKQVIGINHQRAGGGAVIDRRSLGYDHNQNKTSRAQMAPFSPGGDMTTNIWAYTPLNQLRRAINTKGTGSTSRSYKLDRQGNRLCVTNGPVVEVYTRDATLPEPADFQMDQYTFTPFGAQQYDHNGNLAASTHAVAGPIPTQSLYFYDYANRLVEVGRPGAGGLPEVVASFTYDALGHRISKTSNNPDTTQPPVTAYYVYRDLFHREAEPNGSIIETRADGPSGGLNHVYCWGGDQAGKHRDAVAKGVSKLASFTGTGALEYYFHSDDLGNVLALTDSNGNVVERCDYGDYGEPQFLNSDGSPLAGSDGLPVASSPVGNPFLFRGMFWDGETGLYAAGFEKGWPCRYEGPRINAENGTSFDPKTGRYIIRSGTAGVGSNAYTAFGDNPWSAHTEPTGPGKPQPPGTPAPGPINGPVPERPF